MQRQAWIVGASRGMGRAVAERLAGEGWDLWLSARSSKSLEEVATVTGGKSIPMDATQRPRVQEAVDTVFASAQPQLIIMNVGDYQPMPAEAFDVAVFERLYQINFLATVYLLDALIPRMRGAGGQILLNVSASAYRGLPLGAPYSAPKAAILNMAEALRPELKREGISLRVINPGFVRSRLTDKNPFPMPFLLQPEAAAHRIVAQLDASGFEIAFPRRLIWPLKLLRCLPYRWYFQIVDRWVLR